MLMYKLVYTLLAVLLIKETRQHYSYIFIFFFASFMLHFAVLYIDETNNLQVKVE